MNPAAILALISTLYEQIVDLTAENATLRQQLAEAQASPQHAGTIQDPGPRPAMGETRVQHA